MFKKSRTLRRTLATVAATLALSAVATATAAPAEAWTGSADVNLVGFASCKSAPYALDAVPSATWVYVESTGEVAEQPVNYWTSYWEAHLHTVPPDGSWVDTWIYCDVPGIEPGWRLAGSTFVNRPWFGWAVSEGWVRA